MKPALVLGLALAASAMAADQAENELFVAPQGKLTDLAKKYPGMIMYDDDELVDLTLPYRTIFTSQVDYNQHRLQNQHQMIRNEMNDRLKYQPFIKRDEVTDDELAAVLRSRESFKTEEEYQKYYKRAQRSYDDVADDELQMITSNDVIRRVYTTYYDMETGTWRVSPNLGQYTIYLDDNDELFARPLGPLRVEADDEFLAVNQPQKPQKRPFEESKHAILCRNRPDHPFCGGPKRPLIKPSEADDEELYYVPGMRIQDIHRDDADDELFRGLPSKENFSSYEAYVRFLRKMDEADDDELLASGQYEKPAAPRFYVLPPKQICPRDNKVADDEFLASDQDEKPARPYCFLPRRQPQNHQVADDELALRPNVPKEVQRDDESADDELGCWAPVNERPPRRQFAADDELVYLPKPEKHVFDRDMPRPARMSVSEAILRDDGGDDVLVYLGQLIRDGGYIPRPYFDDEFRAEKPGKSQEKTQKTEGPKNKKKLRPVNERPAYQDYVL